MLTTNGFPFPPYAIQSDFMRSVHEALDVGGIALLESPTGTGKTLSLICGTLSWFEKHVYARPANSEEPSSDPLEAHMQKMRREEEESAVREQAELRSKVAREVRRRANNGAVAAKEKGKSSKKRARLAEDELLLVEEVRAGDSDDSEEGERGGLLSEASTTMRVYYTSRTHSQLAQFCDELKKTGFYCRGAAAASVEETLSKPQVWSVALGSRAALCVVEAVRGAGSQAAISDACRNKRESKGGCECNKAEAVEALAVECLANGLVDVEELYKRGLRRGACSYYASRQLMRQCDVVVLPYQMLLHEPTRAALGIELAGSIVIVDEAHNLTDAISSVYSASLSRNCVAAADHQISSYLERYRARLSHDSLVFVKQLQGVLRGLAAFLDARCAPTSAAGEDDCMMEVTRFLAEADMESVNVFRLVEKIGESQIANKLRGFCLKDQAGAVALPNAFYSVAHFLDCLRFPDGDGRILAQRKQRAVQFVLLSPGKCFEKMASQCRAVLLAGGTLSPMQWMASQLTPDDVAVRNRLRLYSFGHVVPKENVLVLALATGPLGGQLSFEARWRHDMHAELLSALRNLRRATPGGMVVFFPSYKYQEEFAASVNGQLGHVHRSQQGAVGNAVFEAYAAEVERGGSATLWSVVGGSLSEGINFSDNLARCVVMVGVPYPNPKDPVLQERGKRSDKYADTLAGRAVNQSIGRAIRHIGDYACVVLLDRRYVSDSVASMTPPSWMRPSLSTPESFGAALVAVRQFFVGRK